MRVKLHINISVVSLETGDDVVNVRIRVLRVKEHLARVLVGQLAQLDNQLDVVQLEGGLGAVFPDIAGILIGDRHRFTLYNGFSETKESKSAFKQC